MKLHEINLKRQEQLKGEDKVFRENGRLYKLDGMVIHELYKKPPVLRVAYGNELSAEYKAQGRVFHTPKSESRWSRILKVFGFSLS